jgi:hypothetical protein
MKLKNSVKYRRKTAIRKMAPYLRRVGEIASLWSQLELQLDMLIWDLLEARQPAAACVTAQLGSASGRLRAIKALTDLYGAAEETKRTINKFASQIDALQIKRNRAVHDAWQTGVNSRRVYQLRVAIKDNKLLFDYDQRSVLELDRTIAQIRGLFLRACRLRVRAVPLLLSSRAKTGLKPFARFETNPFPRASSGSRKRKAAISRAGNEGP